MTAGFWAVFHGPLLWRTELMAIEYFTITCLAMALGGVVLLLAYTFLMIRRRRVDREGLLSATTGLLIAAQFLAVGITFAEFIS